MQEKEKHIHNHEQAVQSVLDQIPDDMQLCELADLFKNFGDFTRVKILYALLESELCVYDISKLLNMGQSAISHHLRILKQSKLVKSRREGKNMLYSLADLHVQTIIGQGMDHIQE